MFKKIAQALKKTKEKFTQAVASVIPGKKKLTQDDVDLIEEILIGADVGVETTMEIIDELTRRLEEGEISGADAVEILKSHLLDVLGEPGKIVVDRKPFVIFVVGVNGTGKTTTIGKLAKRYRTEGKKVLLAAGDTFRAAAREQLQVWADRVGVDLFGGAEGADPASVIFDALKHAQAKNYDIVIADTAGRLHTKKNLMEELKKIARVADKALPGAPHEVLLVIDATTGQNGLVQAEVFAEAIPVTGLVLTKLDGTARGGIAVAIRRKLGIPIKLVGVGEKEDDLLDFAPDEYVEALIGGSQSVDNQQDTKK